MTIALSQALSDLVAALNRWMAAADGHVQYDADLAWLELGEAQLRAMNALKPSTAPQNAQDSPLAAEGEAE